MTILLKQDEWKINVFKVNSRLLYGSVVHFPLYSPRLYFAEGRSLLKSARLLLKRASPILNRGRAVQKIERLLLKRASPVEKTAQPTKKIG